MAYLVIYAKIFQIPAIIHFFFFLIPLTLPIYNWGEGSNYVFVPLQKTKYPELEIFFDAEFDCTSHQTTNI